MNRFALFFAPILVAPLTLSSACSSSTTPAATGDAAAADGPTDAGSGTQCTSARDKLLGPIAQVATGEVLVLSDSGGVKTIYVDASVGGSMRAASSPRVYVNLAEGKRVDVSDKAAFESTEWDLALKRTVIYTNSGEGGPGQGGAARVNKPFASVTAADADAAEIVPEQFFDESCTALPEPLGGPATTFMDWYDYDQATNIPTPRAVTYIVKGADGTRYKVGIKANDALADGGSRNMMATAFYLLQVSAL
ncbi:MAG: HmuY family protein [Labilithrix sp.]|nr:HmuY family protein [Labilithrix sp.]